MIAHNKGNHVELRTLLLIKEASIIYEILRNLVLNFTVE